MKWEIIIALSSSTIALCALVYSVFQGKQLQKHNRLSVKPHLTSWDYVDGENGYYKSEIINNGLGPAIIERFIVQVDGKVISGEREEPIKKALKILFPDINYHSSQAYMGKFYSMTAKERCKVLTIQFQDQPYPDPEFVLSALNRAELLIDYKSFYGENDHYSSKNERLNRNI